MTTIETTESISQEKSLQIGDDPCIACGYSLLGIADDGKCPECGLAAIRSRQRRTIEDLPEKSLRRMATGAGMLVLTGMVMITVVLLLVGFDLFYLEPRFHGPVAECVTISIPMVIAAILFRGATLYATSGQALWEIAPGARKRRKLWYCIAACAGIQVLQVWLLCAGSLLQFVLPWTVAGDIFDRFFPIVWVMSLTIIPLEFLLIALLAGRARQMARWTNAGESISDAIRGAAYGTMIAIPVLFLFGVVTTLSMASDGGFVTLLILVFTLLLWTMMFLDARKLPARELRRRTLARRSVQVAVDSVISAPPIEPPH